jgi:hypothetical protein
MHPAAMGACTLVEGGMVLARIRATNVWGIWLSGEANCCPDHCATLAPDLTAPLVTKTQSHD